MLMSFAMQIVFLGAVVGPEVAAAAAKTALEVLLDDSPEPKFSGKRIPAVVSDSGLEVKY